MLGLKCNQIQLTSWLNIITTFINIILTTSKAYYLFFLKNLYTHYITYSIVHYII